MGYLPRAESPDVISSKGKAGQRTAFGTKLRAIAARAEKRIVYEQMTKTAEAEESTALQKAALAEIWALWQGLRAKASRTRGFETAPQ